MSATHTHQSSSGSAMAAESSTSLTSSGVKPDLKPSPSIFDVNSSADTILLERRSAEEEAMSPPPKRTARTWISSRLNNFSISHPRTYSHVSRVILWVRGPRPKEDLPPPSHFLDINFSSRKHSVYLPIESTLTRLTKPTRKMWLFFILTIGYIVGMGYLSRAQSFSNVNAINLTCLATYWTANSKCGLDGRDCLPLDTSSELDFRCPPGCQGAILQNPRTVGAGQMAFVPLIVGGGDVNKTYRADSFICASAQHAGVTTEAKGGCGRIHLVGEYTNFLPLVANGLESIGFPSVFPLAYRLSNEAGQCRDLRDAALAINVVVTALIFLVFQPSALAVYWSLVCIGYWNISLFSDPVGSTPSIERQFGKFLPLLYIAYVFWRAAFRYTLPFILKFPIQACVLYGLPFWVGVLNNRTFDRLPLSRLTASDIHKRPGGLATLIVLILVILVCSINQLRVIQKTGWLPYYIKWYAVGGLVLLALALLPTLSLRIHHYILPMLLLPGTAFPTRLSAIYQGLLLGLFLHGVARWNYDSIVQTAQSLRGDATLGSLLPTFLTNSTTFNPTIPLTNQTLSWEAVLPGDPWLGFSLLVDDVERYAGAAIEYPLAKLDPSLPHFFRLAFLSDSALGDYTKAATLWPNGTWVDPLPGPSY